MTEREKLIDLIRNYNFNAVNCNSCTKDNDECEKCSFGYLADYLLENGVIVMPCKLGDDLFYEKDGKIVSSTVDKISYETYGDTPGEDVYTMINGYGYSVTFEDVGKLVFLTEAEAVKNVPQSVNEVLKGE